MRAAIFTFALVLAPVAVSAAPVAPEDLFKITFLSSAALSPDGAHVLVVASRMNGPKNSYDRTIELVNVAGGKLTHNVTGKVGDGDFAWNPDGRSFVFVRAVDKGKPQLYRYTLGSGAIVRLTNVAQGVSSPVFSHAGDRIALTVTDSDPALNAFVNFTRAGFTPKASEKKSDIEIIDQLFFETNGQGYTYRDHQHIWIVAADGSHPRALTSGPYSENFDAWSPDDKTILFDSLRYESVDSGVGDVYTIPAAGGTMAKVASPLPSNGGLFFSTDGSRVYTFSADVKDSAERPALVSSNRDGSDRRVVVERNAAGWGDSLLADMKEGGGLCGAPLPDGKRALLNIDGAGYANLRALDLERGSFSDVTPAHGEAWSCSITTDGREAAYLYSDFEHPADVYVVAVAGGTPRQLTNVNGAYLASVQLSQPQEFQRERSRGFHGTGLVHAGDGRR